MSNSQRFAGLGWRALYWAAFAASLSWFSYSVAIGCVLRRSPAPAIVDPRNYAPGVLREGQPVVPPLDVPVAGPSTAAVVLAPATQTAPVLVPPPGCTSDPDPLIEGGVGEPCVFWGRVVDELGEPLAGATVLHIPDLKTMAAMGITFTEDQWQGFTPEQQSRFARASTGADGRFCLPARTDAMFPPENGAMFTKVPSLVVSAPGRASRGHLCSNFTGVGYDAGDIVIEPGGRLIGRAVNDQGEPLAGAKIYPLHQAVAPVHVASHVDRELWDAPIKLMETTADAEGRFAMDGLWHGSIRLLVSFPRRVSSELEGVLIRAGEVTDVGDVIVSVGECIAGRVVDADGVPIGGARVGCFAQWPDSVQEEAVWWGPDANLYWSTLALTFDPDDIVTDRDGAFELWGLEHKPQEVFVAAPGFDVLRLRRVMPNGPPLIATLETESDVELAFVADETGEPVAVTDVKAFRRSGNTSYAGVEGQRLPLPVERSDESPGLVRVRQLGPVGTIVVVSAPGRATASLELEGVPPGTAGRRTLRLPAEARLSGRVVDQHGNPVSHCRVQAQPSNRGPEMSGFETRTDENGLFRLDGLGAGPCTYTVGVSLASGEQTRRVTLVAGEDQLAGDFRVWW